MNTILIIDDDPAVVRCLQKCLQNAGFNVLTAEHGGEGLKQVRRYHPDLVLCDIDMPEVNGFALLEALRRTALTADIPVIFLTGRTTPADFRQGMVRGAENYLPKPVSREDLLAAITTCLEKRALQKQREDTRVGQLATEVATTLSHELRTPLNGILPIPDLLEVGDQPPDPATQHALRDILRESSGRLNRAVERFLFYSELLALSQRHETTLLTLAPHGLGPFLAACAHRLAEGWSRPLDLSVEGSAPVNLPPQHLEYLMGELIDNAFKFSSAGTPVTVELAVTDGALILRVDDQGRGLAEAEINSLRVFRQFDRATHEQQGFGLGLSIVHLLIQIYRGELSIQSQPGQGTSVTVRLPISDPADESGGKVENVEKLPR